MSKDLVVYTMETTDPVKWHEWGRVKPGGEIVGPKDFKETVESKVKRWNIDFSKDKDWKRLQLLLSGMYVSVRME